MDDNFGDKVEQAFSGIANFLKFDKNDREKRKQKEMTANIKTQEDFNVAARQRAEEKKAVILQ